jgi:CDP-glucose 4,6-dehydratase
MGKLDFRLMEKIFNSVYKGKRVLITGHTGFKGSWLTSWLLLLGAEVIGYSLEPDYEPNLFETIELQKKIIHITGNVIDEEHLLYVFRRYKPDFVFHLAAQPLVRYSYREPRLTYETNVMGTVNILEAIRKTKSVKVCVVITSDKCYENREWVFGYRETDPMGGYDPYSSSKGCTELVVAAYRKSFFIDSSKYSRKHIIALSSVRAGNVIGGGDWGEDRLIPDCVRALSQNRKILIRNPEAIRPWQFVLEPLSGYLWLAALMYQNSREFSDAWNFGPFENCIYNVEEVVKKIIELWGKGEYEVKPDSKYHEGKLLKLDISKSRFYLDWKPIYNIDEALEKTMRWYNKYYKENANMFNYTLKQIKEYVGRAKKQGISWSQSLR